MSESQFSSTKTLFVRTSISGNVRKFSKLDGTFPIRDRTHSLASFKCLTILCHDINTLQMPHILRLLRLALLSTSCEARQFVSHAPVQYSDNPNRKACHETRELQTDKNMSTEERLTAFLQTGIEVTAKRVEEALQVTASATVNTLEHVLYVV